MTDHDTRNGGMRFADFSYSPGISPDGVNRSSGFKVNKVNTQESIKLLTHINGIQISELERRMRPNKYEGTGCGMYSYDGFIGQEESLIDSLARANRVVTENGYTHQELSNWLSQAVATHEDPAIEHTPQYSKRFTLNGMDFDISYLSTVSRGQESPFQNPEVEGDEEQEGWEGNYILKNITTGRALEFTPQIPRWVQKWGFYEGFETPHHVNPQMIIDIFNKTDRVYENRDEIAARLTKEYLAQGWESAAIDYPLTNILAFPESFKDLRRYSDDLEGDDKISHLLMDKDFVVITNGVYNPFYSHGSQVAIYDRATKELLVNHRDIADYIIVRENADGITTVRVEVRQKKGVAKPIYTPLGKIELRNKEDENGWVTYQKSESFSPDDIRYLMQFGRMNASSEDGFSLFKSKRGEFMWHKRGDAVWFFYKTDYDTGEKVRMALNREGLQLLGIANVAEGDYVSDVKNVQKTADGKTSGVLVIKGTEYPFSI